MKTSNSIMSLASASLALTLILSCAESPDLPSGNEIELAECGGGYYNPETHFCVGNSFYKKCGGMEYNIENQMCDERDDKIYQYAKVGSQTWMTENLNYSSDYTLGYCYGADIFGAERENLETCDNGHGRVYRWTEINAQNDFPQGICPGGWHIPSTTEWQTVRNASIPNEFYIYSGNYNNNPEWPIGWNDRDINGFYWTSTAVNYAVVFANAGITRAMGGTTTSTEKFAINSNASAADIFSVRCIKD